MTASVTQSSDRPGKYRIKAGTWGSEEKAVGSKTELLEELVPTRPLPASLNGPGRTAKNATLAALSARVAVPL